MYNQLTFKFIFSCFLILKLTNEVNIFFFLFFCGFPYALWVMTISFSDKASKIPIENKIHSKTVFLRNENMRLNISVKNKYCSCWNFWYQTGYLHDIKRSYIFDIFGDPKSARTFKLHDKEVLSIFVLWLYYENWTSLFRCIVT